MDAGKVKTHLPFLAIFLAASALYLSILLTSQSHPDGDESVVGVMAWHILETGDRPIFFYGQPYGGGAAIEAHLATIPFLIFGPSPLALKSVSLILGLLTLVLCYGFCLRYLGRRHALISTALLATATALIEFHFKMRGGYAALMTFSITILWLFSAIAHGGGRRWLIFFALGLASGFAYYNMEHIIPLLLTLALASLYWKDVFWRRRPVLLILAGLLVGLSPIIYFNLTHDWINLKYILRQGGGDLLQRASENIVLIFTHHLPRFFNGRNVDTFIESVPLASMLEYILQMICVVLSLTLSLPPLKKLFKGLFKKPSAYRSETPPGPISLVVLFIVVFLVFSAMAKGTGDSPRYFIPLYPLLAIAGGHGIAWLLQGRRVMLKVAGVLLLGALVVCGVMNHLSYIRPSAVVDEVTIAKWEVAQLPTSGDTAGKIIQHLQQKKIQHFRAAFFISWRIIFESKEALVGSSHGLWPRGYRYPLHDYKVSQARRVAIIFHNRDLQLQWFRRTRQARDFESAVKGEYTVYIGPQPPSWKATDNFFKYDWHLFYNPQRDG